jgi:hypothetical protein
MKNICTKILPLMMLFPFMVKGQWTTNGSNIYSSNTGNVGIGTTSPISKLNVQSDDLQLQLTGASDVNKRLRLGYNTTGNYGSIQALRSGTTYDNFNINPDGGNVGVGTVAPSAKLHINASLTESAIKIGSPNVQGNINVPIGASTGGYNLDFYTWRDIQVDQIGARIRAERINSYQPNNALVQSMDLVFSTSTGGIQTELTEKLRINSTGNVSIGTSDAKGYKLAVNGNILATEIKVQAAPWPDYVFSKNYNLPALQSIEKHIKKEGYLPDMPSAKEVESNGINVGEMNAKLLKKIEELTLYIIDQNKELLNQKDQLNNLKKDNLELKKAVFGRKH